MKYLSLGIRLFMPLAGIAAMVVLLAEAAWMLTPSDPEAIARASGFQRSLSGLAESPEDVLHGGKRESSRGLGNSAGGGVAGFRAGRAPKDSTVHRVAEWPVESGRTFAESPKLAIRVQDGSLPPVEERLPQDPLVIVPPHQNGPYGGTWARMGNGPQDVGIYHHRFAYDGLVRWDAMCRNVLPNLAVSWTISEDCREYTFKLRRGVRWSDGTPFTSDDIVFWYEDIIQNEEVTPVIPRDFTPGGELMRLEKLDDYSVRFRFTEPNGLFLKRLASGRGYEMVEFPAHYLKQFHPRYVPREHVESMARAREFDVWTKLFDDIRNYRNPDVPRLWPWVMKEPPPARPVVLERNPYYWKVDPDGNQLPYIDRMTFDIYDPETINLKAINGELGMQSRHLIFDNYPLFVENQESGGYRIYEWESGQGGTNVLLPNHNHEDPVVRELIENRHFRIALSLAIDREEINAVSLFGIGKPRQMAPPATSPFYSKAYEEAYVEFDPERANAILDSIGLTRRDARGMRLLPDGRTMHFDIEVSGTSGRTTMIQLVARHWRNVGVSAEVKEMARQLWTFRKRAAMHDMCVWSGSDEQDPTLEPRWFVPIDENSYHAPAYGRWYITHGNRGDQPPADMRRAMDVLGEIQKTADESKQIRLFEEIIDLNKKNLWVIGLVGDVPAIGLVPNTFRNVPEVAVSGWAFRFPGNTAPECYAIDPSRATGAHPSN